MPPRLIAPVSDLVRMKLTSYRLKDRVHLQDLDSVGLISPEIESHLSDILLARLGRSQSQRMKRLYSLVLNL